MDEHYLHALTITPGVSSRTIGVLLERFGSGEAIWQAPENDIFFSGDIDPNVKEALLTGRKHIDPKKEWEKLTASNITAFAKNDPRYPALLREIPDAPHLLYARGTYDFSIERPMIAIVGSRKHTHYGEQVAYRLAEELAHTGIVVVSGLAFGIDALAHQAALEIGQETIAVMGNGLADRFLYPKSNVSLAKKIIERGALLSEYPPETQAQPYTFPARNRIIAGMTLGTIVIEAAEESGSLITARLALDYDREVFAVPGPIFSPASAGTNRLIGQGAKIVTCVRDILEEFPELALGRPEASTAVSPASQTLSPEEKTLIALLSHEPLHVDKIIKAARLETSSANSILALLEIKGLVKNIGGMNYIKL